VSKTGRFSQLWPISLKTQAGFKKYFNYEILDCDSPWPVKPLVGASFFLGERLWLVIPGNQRPQELGMAGDAGAALLQES
jgi:hypothetical protein